MSKKKSGRRVWRGVTTATASLLALSVCASTVVDGFRTDIDKFLGTKSTKLVTENSDGTDLYTFKSDYTSTTELLHGIQDVGERMSEEGSVLLKNNGALPLTQDETQKITLLGFSSYYPVQGGDMGSSLVENTGTDADTVDMVGAFKAKGFGLNQTVADMYEALQPTFKSEVQSWGGTIEYNHITAPSTTGVFSSKEPSQAALDGQNAAWKDSMNDNNVMIVTIARAASENGSYNPGTAGVDPTQNLNQTDPLGLSDDERDLINAAVTAKAANGGKVIVLLNNASAMEVQEIEDNVGVDAILQVGLPGGYGFYGVADILSGAVSPSGHLTDTYAVKNANSPAAQNFGDLQWTNANPDIKMNDAIVEAENIYIGYKYYETRYFDTVMNQGNASSTVGSSTGSAWNYDDEVTYPFGYGLSYTDFEWSDYDTSWDGDTCTVTVKVTNTGDVAGKDVVQVYAQSPYTDYDKANKVEKAAVELVGYAKTAELAPGASETVKITFDQEQLKSYDYVNAKTYILDAGDYYITAAKNAHEAVNNILSAKGKTVADGMTADGDTAFVATYTPENGTVDTTTYKLDTTTGVEITNQLDHANGGLQYLSRSDWTGTWPTVDGEVSDQISTWGNPINGTDASGKAASYTYRKTISKEDLAKLDSFDSLNPTDFSTLTDEIVYGKDNGLGLIDMRGLDYNDPKWNDLLDQLTPSDYQTLITQSGYGTAAIKSVDKPSTTDRDTATGLIDYGFDASGNFYFKGNITHCGVIVLAQTYNDDLAYHYGENIGDESYYLGVDGWYAPAVNMHRTAFSGRNSEYYSEDPFIGGHIASLECEGVASRGMYVFVKHYAINDQEDHRGDREGQYSIATFLNEQAAREIYLKPFEMSVKDADCHAVMSSFNYIGNRWAGGCSELLQNVLRGEWGFLGFVETDYFGVYGYMTADQGVRNGSDLMLCTTGNDYNNVTVLTNSSKQAMRTAAKNILYTVVNSRAYEAENLNPGMAKWKIVLIGADVVAALLIVGLEYTAIKNYKKRKEEEEEV